MATKPNDDSSLSHTRWNCKYHKYPPLNGWIVIYIDLIKIIKLYFFVIKLVKFYIFN